MPKLLKLAVLKLARCSAASRLRELELEAVLPLLMSVIGILGVAPFVVIRAIDGNAAMAIVNAVVTATFVGVFWAIYRHQAVRPASVVLAIISMIGVTANLYLNGSSQVFWVYPVIVGMFFLMRPLEATTLTGLLVLATLPALVQEEQSRVTYVVVLTFLTTIGNAIAFAALTSVQRRRLKAAALVDPLTGVANRRAMADTMLALTDDEQRPSPPVALIMLDIDYFKRINDNYGHAAGDRVLIAVARCIRSKIRAGDHLFRVGGEEFIVIVDGAGVDVARRIGETLREAVAKLAIPSLQDPAETLQVTISLGVAELLATENADHWYKRADDALYEAKRSGRNQIFLAEKTVSLSGTDSFPVQVSAQGR